MATQHRRQPAGSSKKAVSSHGRALRPTIQTPKRGGNHKSAKSVHIADESDEEMATSFLQYCTMCEKQIITPNNSVLYCSESCKRKDRDKPPYFQSEQSSPPLTPLKTFSFEDLQSAPDIVPRRSPTSADLRRNPYSFSSIAEEDDDDDDLSRCKREHRPRLSREDSEASQYLRQFHGSDNDDAATPTTKPRVSRGGGAAGSQSGISLAGAGAAAPSLSHTPGSYATSGTSLPYTPHSPSTALQHYFTAADAAHPLPSRNHPHSAASYGAKSIELVTPFAAAATAALATTAPEQHRHHHPLPPGLKTSPTTATTRGAWAEGEMLQYEKKSLESVKGRAAAAAAAAAASTAGDKAAATTGRASSLKQLFAFEQMRAPPAVAGP